jgi:hypothetical protein
MHMKNVLVWVAAVGIAVVAAPRPADACSPLTFSRMSTLPADGATGVPTNTQVAIEYAGSNAEAALTQLVVRPMGGQGIAAPASVVAESGAGRVLVLAKPASALTPNTKYEVLDKFPNLPCASSPCAGAAHVVATFTTGDGPDTKAPTFAGLTSVPRKAQSCDNTACCGPYTAVELDLMWDPATGETGEVRYNVYSDNKLVLARVTSAKAFIQCSGTGAQATTPGAILFGTGSIGQVYVRAVDLAGNEDDNFIEFLPRLLCLEFPGDAGVDVPDAPGSSAPGTGTGGGCAVAGSGGGAGPALLLLALLAVRRRRCAR